MDRIKNNESEFDSYIKKRYERHFVNPDPDLWNSINVRLLYKKSIRQNRRIKLLKTASIMLAVSLISVFVYYKISIQQKSGFKKIGKNEVIHSPVIQESKKNNIILNETDNTGNKDSNTNVIEKRQLQKSIKFTEDYYNQKPSKNISLNSNTEEAKIIAKSAHMPEQNTAGQINNIEPHSFTTKENKKIESLIMAKGPAKRTPKFLASINLQRQIIPGNINNLLLRGNTSENNQNKLFIEIFFSPEISYRTLSNNPGFGKSEYNKPYFNARDKSNYTYSAGLLTGYSLFSRFAVKSGLIYSQYALRFNTESIHVLHDNTTGYYIYTSSGRADLSIVSTDTISSETFLKSYIQFNYINIPLIIDYKFSNNCSLSFGLDFNYLISQSINWQAQDYNGNSEQRQNKIAGLNSVKIVSLLGISFEKPIFKNLKLIINPVLKFDLMALSKTAPVKAYPYSLGLQGGLRYYF